VLVGCGDKHLDKPLPQTLSHLRVRGPWPNDGRIPKRFTCDGAQRAPALVVSRPPGTKDTAIVMTDPDAPGGTFVHWTRWDSGTSGRNSFGKTGYSGPCPPKGDKPHHYVITAYALRRPLALPAGSAPDKVVAAIRNTSFASGSLIGLYSR
jgi:phosphatidylethanolamine-binding protein (PEBP) family uncharacterized protein